MSEHARDHAWNASNRLEKDESYEPFSFAHHIGLVGVMTITCGEIGTPSQKPNGVKGNPI
jgi:hypothetical protein